MVFVTSEVEVEARDWALAAAAGEAEAAEVAAAVRAAAAAAIGEGLLGWWFGDGPVRWTESRESRCCLEGFEVRLVAMLAAMKFRCCSTDVVSIVRIVGRIR